VGDTRDYNPPFSSVHSRRNIHSIRAGWPRCCRVSEDSRPPWHRRELLDGSVGASGSGSCQCLAGENFAGGGCRCRPRPGARCLQRLPHPLERRRPRHSNPEASQSRVREAAIACLEKAPVLADNRTRGQKHNQLRYRAKDRLGIARRGREHSLRVTRAQGSRKTFGMCAFS
jgi:hypothetical protein